MADALDERFGELRALTQQTYQFYGYWQKLFDLLSSARELDPAKYDAVWKPYVNAALRRPLFSILFLSKWDRLEAWAELIDAPVVRLWLLHPALPDSFDYSSLRLVRVLLARPYSARRAQDRATLLKVLSAPALRNLEELQVENLSLDAALIEALCEPQLQSVTTLELTNADLTDKALAQLGGALLFAGLEELDLSRNHIRDQGLEALARSTQGFSLRRLNLSQNQITGGGLRAMLDADRLQEEADELDLKSNAITDEGLVALLSAPRAIKVLDLSQNAISAPGAGALATADLLADIRKLGLEGNKLGDAGVATLASSPHTAALEHLDLGQNGLSEASALALANAEHLGSLRTLDLTAEEIGERGLFHLTTSERLPERVRLRWLVPIARRRGPLFIQLRRLLKTNAILQMSWRRRMCEVLEKAWTRDEEEFEQWRPFLQPWIKRWWRPLVELKSVEALERWSQILKAPAIKLVLDAQTSEAGLDAILSSSALARVTQLQMRGCALGRERLERLLGAPAREALSELHLIDCGLDADALACVEDAQHLGGLKALYLDDNPLGDAGMEQLARAPWLAQIEHLSLTGCELGPAAGATLAELEGVKLRSLRLSGNHLGDAGVAALAQRAPLGQYGAVLWLEDNQIGDAGVQALAQAKEMRVLGRLRLGGNPIGEQGLRAMAESEYLRAGFFEELLATMDED